MDDFELDPIEDNVLGSEGESLEGLAQAEELGVGVLPAQDDSEDPVIDLIEGGLKKAAQETEEAESDGFDDGDGELPSEFGEAAENPQGVVEDDLEDALV